MSRYVRKFNINSNIDVVYSTINSFLLSQGYKPKNFNGFNVYKKGSGLIKEPNFFQFTVDNNILIMETWTAFSVLPDIDVGEYDHLNTPWYICKEKGWQNRVFYIENLLVNQLGCTVITEQQCFNFN